MLVTKLSGIDKITELLTNMALYEDVEALEKLILNYPKTPFIASILIAAISLFTQVIAAGYSHFTLKAYRQQEAGIGTIFDEFSRFLKIIWLSILIGIFTFLWSLLFVIPGIVAAYRYSWAYFILFDNPELSAI